MAGNDRITVTLTPGVRSELNALTKSTGLSQTDIVNRAVSLYALIEKEAAAGGEILLRNRDTGQTASIRIL